MDDGKISKPVNVVPSVSSGGGGVKVPPKVGASKAKRGLKRL